MNFVVEWKPIEKLTPSVFELTFTPDRPLDFKAGQYVSIVVPSPTEGGKPLRRPYSIASEPRKQPIELCIQRIESGPGNTYLASLQSGDSFSCYAPYGFLIYHARPGRDVWFISTGTGLAPFRSMILSQGFSAAPPRRTVCLLGVRTEKEILYAKDLDSVSGVEWVPCISRPEKKTEGVFTGRVTDYLRASFEKIVWRETDFYLCGNGAMIEEVKQVLKDQGVAKEAIHQEVYFKPPKS